MADKRQTKRLTALQIERLKAPGRHGVGDGLYLQITSSDTKSWIFRHYFGPKRRDMGLGPYPLIGLAQVRTLVDDARRLLAAGRDPMAERQTARQAANPANTVTFAEAMMRYIASRASSWSNPKSALQWRSSIETHAVRLLPMPIESIATSDVQAVLAPIWTKLNETASRLRGRIETILDHAHATTARPPENPARWKGRLEYLLPAHRVVVKHHEAIKASALPAAMARLAKMKGLSALAVRFVVLTAARAGEATGATTNEIAGAVWTMPPARTKTRRPHRVPLSVQARAVLDAAAKLRRSGEVLLFPGMLRARPLSLTSLAITLRRSAPQAGPITVHGLRSCFRDWCGEQGVARELAEIALAHTTGTTVERAYARSDLLERRHELMQSWSDFACGSKKKAKPRR